MLRPLISLLVLVGAPLVLLMLAPQTALLGFAGVLLAVAIRAVAGVVGPPLRPPDWAGVVLVVTATAAAFGIGVVTAVPTLTAQADELLRRLPEALTAMRQTLDQTSWGRALRDELGPGALMVNVGQGAAGIATAAMARTAGWLTSTLYLLFLGVFLAAAPGIYLVGLRVLVAPEWRDRCDVVLIALGATLRAWIAAQLLAMVIVGTLTYAGLKLLGMPLAGILAVLAAVLGFIPVLGPIIAAIPGLLLAFAMGWSMMAWVAGLYLLVQTVEGNLITPLVQSRAIQLPPALILIAQLFMLTMFGLLGLALAAPLAAVLLVLTQHLYVHGFLERRY